MTWRDRAAIALLVAALAAVAAGMFVPPPPVLPAPATPSVVPVAYREGVLGHPSSVNPLTYRTQADRDLVALLYRGLVRIGSDGTPRPDLASWRSSADGRTYTFAIDPDAYWQDGLPVTSRDVQFTIELVQDPAYKGALGASWRGITVVQVSPSIVEFDLTAPLAGFLNMAMLPILPAHGLAGTAVEDLADSDFNTHPIGSGPFRLAEIDDSHAVLERVRSITPQEFGFPLQEPTARPSVAFAPPVMYDTLSELELRFFDTPAQLADAFAAGRLEGVAGLPPDSVVTALTRPGARLIDYPSSTMTAVALNLRPEHPEFRNADVRRGLLAAIDRDALVADTLAGHAVRADVPVPPSSWAYDPTVVTPTPYSQTGAVASLQKGGWTQAPGGSWSFGKPAAAVSVELLTPTSASDATAFAIASRIAVAWQAIGIPVVIRALPAAEYVAAIRAADFDAAVVDVELGLDPDLWPLLSSTEVVTGGTNVAGYQNADLDGYLTKARKALDQTSRMAALRDVEKSLSENNPILPLCFRNYPFVVAGSVQNVSARQLADPSGRYWDVIDWRLASDG